MTTLKHSFRDYRPFSIYSRKVKTFFYWKIIILLFEISNLDIKKNKFSYKIIQDKVWIFVFLIFTDK